MLTTMTQYSLVRVRFCLEQSVFVLYHSFRYGVNPFTVFRVWSTLRGARDCWKSVTTF